MKRRNKIGLFVLLGFAGVVTIASLIHHQINSRYRNDIPGFNGSTAISEAVQDQIDAALKLAQRNRCNTVNGIISRMTSNRNLLTFITP